MEEKNQINRDEKGRFLRINNERGCLKCGKSFMPHDKLSKFCSRECYNEYKKKGIIKYCEQCGKGFYVYPSNKDKRKFCSKECCAERLKIIQKGKHISPKTEFKKGQNKGLTFQEIHGMNSEKIRKKINKTRRENGWFKDSERTKQRMSRAYKYHTNSGCFEKGDIRLIGENNPLWNNGSSFDLYGIEFNIQLKNQIRKRDNQICMNCKIHREKLSRALDIHHINYDKKCNLPQNMISLCRKCHGLTNINREYWTKLFKKKLSKLYNYQYSSEGEIILKLNNPGGE